MKPSTYLETSVIGAYLDNGDEVFILDDLSTGSIHNIQHLRQHPRFHYTIDTVHKPRVVPIDDQLEIKAATVGVLRTLPSLPFAIDVFVPYRLLTRSVVVIGRHDPLKDLR